MFPHHLHPFWSAEKKYFPQFFAKNTKFPISANNSGSIEDGAVKFLRRAANMNQQLRTGQASILAIQVWQISHVLQMITTAAHLVKTHLDFCISWGQTMIFAVLKV